MTPEKSPFDLPATDSVFSNPFYQCELTVLDSAIDRQEPFADLGRSSGSLDYLPPFLSGHSSYRVRLRPCCQQVAQLANPDRSSCTSPDVDCDSNSGGRPLTHLRYLLQDKDTLQSGCWKLCCSPWDCLYLLFP
jgi:hypothetical protein